MSGDWGLQHLQPLCNLAGPLLDLLSHCEIGYLNCIGVVHCVSSVYIVGLERI